MRFEDSRWLVGVQSFHVGSSYLSARDVCFMARPYLRMLMQDTGETANLALIEEDELVYLAQVESSQMMRALARPGVKAPWSCSAVGKACLAFSSRPEAERLVGYQGIVQMTGKSHVTAQSLWDDIAQVCKANILPLMMKSIRQVFVVWPHLCLIIMRKSLAHYISGPSVRVSQASMVKSGNLYHASHASYHKHLAGHGQQVNLFRQQIVPPMRISFIICLS